MTIHRKTRLAHSVSITAIALFSSVPAMAQSANEQAPSPGEIIVTAQRRSENVLKVPVSVTVVGSEQLAQRGINDLTAVTKLAPSLQVAQDNTFSVRGVGTATFANTVEASVSQVVDDVVLGNREYAANAFYDIARVEVLNGPQGLLFGKNASAGLINIVTNKPMLGEMSFNADGELVQRARPGDDGTGYQIRSTANLPVGENAALRLNFIYSDQDPITVSNVNPAVRNDLGLENLGVRAKFLFEPSDSLSVYLIGDYNRQRGITGRYDITFRQFGPGRGIFALVHRLPQRSQRMVQHLRGADVFTQQGFEAVFGQQNLGVFSKHREQHAHQKAADVFSVIAARLQPARNGGEQIGNLTRDFGRLDCGIKRFGRGPDGAQALAHISVAQILQHDAVAGPIRELGIGFAGAGEIGIDFDAIANVCHQ